MAPFWQWRAMERGVCVCGNFAISKDVNPWHIDAPVRAAWVQVGKGRVVKITGIQNKGRTATVLLRGSNKLVRVARTLLHVFMCVCLRTHVCSCPCVRVYVRVCACVYVLYVRVCVM